MTQLQPLDDRTLMSRIRAGQPGALEELYRRHSTEIYRFLVRRTRDPELASDLVQEVFLRSWSRGHLFRAGGTRGSVRAWLFQIARNLATDAFHRARREVVGLVETTETVSNAPDPLRRTEARDQLESLHRALLRLSDDDRELLLLARVEGMTYEELAEIRGVRRGTLRTRVSRALHRLRQELQRDEVPSGRDLAEGPRTSHPETQGDPA